MIFSITSVRDSNCTSLPHGLRHTKEPIFIITNIILVPVLVTVGLLGNVFTLVVINRRDMRKQSAVYVYLTALAVCDTCILCLVFPLSLRDADLLPPEIVYSRAMVLYYIIQYWLTNMFKHAATWIMVTVAVVRHFGISKPLTSGRCMTVKASWITVCVIFVSCAILDMARFYELDDIQLQNMCYDTPIWIWTYSEFGRSEEYWNSYPWVIVVTCFIIPFLCILIFNTLLLIHISTSRLKGKGVVRRSNYKRKEMQTTVMLMTVIMVFFLLELPDSIANMCLAIGGVPFASQSKQFSEYLLCANCLSLVHSSINFIFYSMLSSEFRKGFRYTFCRVCLNRRGQNVGSPIGSSRTRSLRKSSLLVGTTSLGSDPSTRIQNGRRCIHQIEYDLKA